MPTITTVDATWDTGVTMDAAELRRADTTMFLGDGSNNGVRGGIVYHGPNSLAVAVNGSDQVSVQAGAAVIPAATGLGVYRTGLSATTGLVNLAARNATNPRIDLVVIQVAGASAVVKTIEGTPAASPTAPALPAQHIELSRATVPATGGGAVTVDSTWRTFATGLGGVLYVPTSARLPGSGVTARQSAVALDTGVAHVWNGTAWVSQTVDWTNLTHQSSFVADATIPSAWSKDNGMISVAIGGNKTTWGGGEAIVTLPVGARPTRNFYCGAMATTDATPVPLLVQTTGVVQTVVGKASGGGITGLLPSFRPA